jgi:hypothetical protein
MTYPTTCTHCIAAARQLASEDLADRGAPHDHDAVTHEAIHYLESGYVDHDEEGHDDYR